MGCQNEIVRMVCKMSTTAGERPTIPVSDDHTDGSWLATDIYIGESFWNSADGIMYNRGDNGIVIIGSDKVYEGLLNQSSTSAPVCFESDNTIGSIVWTRNAQGEYYGTLTGAFLVNTTGVLIGSPNSVNARFIAYRLNDNVVVVKTYNNVPALTDSLLIDTKIVITVQETIAS